ncbi:MAG: anaerobic sulfatase maturase, partial [Firmicutes bacterium]|nr:anaerobic sulfatase maturase [Bacillota bacterium]
MHRSYGIMWKTVSEDCNLACDYCYYSRVLGKPEQVRRPTDVVLEKVLREYLATCGATASIAWQGGEPLLA